MNIKIEKTLLEIMVDIKELFKKAKCNKTAQGHNESYKVVKDKYMELLKQKKK